MDRVRLAEDSAGLPSDSAILDEGGQEADQDYFTGIISPSVGASSSAMLVIVTN